MRPPFGCKAATLRPLALRTIHKFDSVMCSNEILLHTVACHDVMKRSLELFEWVCFLIVVPKQFEYDVKQKEKCV